MKTFRIILLCLCCYCSSIFCNEHSSEVLTCSKIISRGKWGARRPLETEHLEIPLENVVVHHTVTETCQTERECIDVVKKIQDYHMNKKDFPDIGYNFLVGGDGKIYEGTGWHHKGSHTSGYNTKSLGVALIGNFSDKLPSEKQLSALENFLQCAVNLLELTESYKLFGGRQLRNTNSPGEKLYEKLQKFDHYSKTPPNKTVIGENHDDPHQK